MQLTGRPLVQAVEIRGLETIPPEALLRRMETREGAPLDPAALRRDLEAIAKFGPLDPVSVQASYEPLEEGLIRLILTVKENPRLKAITFVGATRFKEKQLRAALPIEIKEGEILPWRAASDVRRAIQKFYSEGGYHETRARVREIEAGPGEVELVAVVDEGERIRIRDLILEGNRSLPAIWITPRLFNQGSWLFFHNYYDDDLFEEDLQAVRALYVDRGFLDVKTRAGVPRPGRNPNEISPVIVIEEGQRYKVGEVTVTGATLFQPGEVNAPFRHLKGRDYAGERLRAAIEKLRALYGNEGYIDLQVDPEFRKHPETGRVDIELRLKEGDVVYVGEVKAEIRRLDIEEEPNALDRLFLWMSPPVKEEAVLRENRLKPGRIYRRFEEVRTEQRLRNLEVFEKVSVRREPSADPKAQDAIIVVEERPEMAYATVFAGYGDVTGPAVGVGFVNPNIGGEANQLRATAIFGRDTRRFVVRYFERYLGDSDNSLDTQAYRFDDRYEGYRQRLYGASSELGHPLSEYLTAYLRLRVEDVKFTRRASEREEPLEPYQTYAARGVLEYDRRDNIAWPTRGFRVSGGAESGYADGFLLKFLHGFGYYKSLYRDVIYAYEHDLGMMPYKADQVGITERFFLGGSNDVRGFRRRGASPRDEGYRRMRVGGATKFVQRQEARFPVFGALKGRLFLDDGLISEKPAQFGSPRVSTGFGFILQLRIVQVEIDFARAVVYEKSDSRRLLHFRLSSGI